MSASQRRSAVSSEKAREEDRALLRRYHEGGDTTAREELIERHLPRLGEQALDRELEVVDLLEGEVHALRDPADDQPHDGLEIARQRRLEVDALGQLRHRGSPMVPSPTTRS